jgi:hypothetical protein
MVTPRGLTLLRLLNGGYASLSTKVERDSLGAFSAQAG